MKLIDYIAKEASRQGTRARAKIIKNYCPSNFGMEDYDDCGCCHVYEANKCEKCWDKELNSKDIPHTCDTCRRYGKSDHNCYYCRHKERPDLWETKEKAHE